MLLFACSFVGTLNRESCGRGDESRCLLAASRRNLQVCIATAHAGDSRSYEEKAKARHASRMKNAQSVSVLWLGLSGHVAL